MKIKNIFTLIFILFSYNAFSSARETGIAGVLMLDDPDFTQYILLNYEIFNIPEDTTYEYYYFQNSKNKIYDKIINTFSKISDTLQDGGWKYFSIREIRENGVRIQEPYGIITLATFDPINEINDPISRMQMFIGYVEDGKYVKVDEKYNLDSLDVSISISLSLKINGLWLSKEDLALIPFVRYPILVRKERTVEEVYLEIRRITY